MQTAEHNLEQLSTALDAMNRAELVVEGGDMGSDAMRALIRSHNFLADKAIDCGMRSDEPDHVAWAAERVAQWLLSVAL